MESAVTKATCDRDAMMKLTANALKCDSAFKEKRIVVLGDLMLDEFIWGRVRRISPEAPCRWSRREAKRSRWVGWQTSSRTCCAWSGAFADRVVATHRRERLRYAFRTLQIGVEGWSPMVLARRP